MSGPTVRLPGCAHRHRRRDGLVGDTIDRRCARRTMGSGAIAGQRLRMLYIEYRQAAIMATPQTPNAFPNFITVLVLVGLPAGPVNRAMSRHAIDSSPDGVMVHVFDDLARLPRYSDALETDETPDAVVALRAAASEADAVLVITSYRGRVP